jgi:hypothetical protein
MSERRHRAAFEQAHAAVTLGPSRQPLPAEFRPVRDEPSGRRPCASNSPEHYNHPTGGAHRRPRFRRETKAEGRSRTCSGSPSFLQYRPLAVPKLSSMSRPRRRCPRPPGITFTSASRPRRPTTDLLCCCGSAARYWPLEGKWFAAALTPRTKETLSDSTLSDSTLSDSTISIRHSYRSLRRLSLVFNAISIIRRIASDRDGWSGCCLAHSSTRAVSAGGIRKAVTGSCPVAGRPPRRFCFTFCLTAIWGLCNTFWQADGEGATSPPALTQATEMSHGPG